ncbi:hypothetical protein [Marinitoga aeolica]|uniref:Uncharacterized protein n=1 Tax=Marinitoga aeolica TaxID=2809031 RepID=A0ABY8PNR2_9BACT|nr:hypothetical protein [Marinitoga aeolica]WGS64226.1 hypothetical protein JRV97_07530 [Marinitoga aeolica]
MKKGFFILLLLLPYLIFAETYYVIGNTVYKGSKNSENEKNYNVEIIYPEKNLNDYSDKKVIVIKDNTNEVLNEIYSQSGNINSLQMDNIKLVGNVLEKKKMKLFEKSHIFSYFLPKDYNYWKVGGRREDKNYMDLSTLDNTIWFRIHKEGYSENNLYKDFELPYGENSFVDFYVEIAGLVSKSKVLPENAYSLAGIIFSFLDENKKSIDKFSFVWSSSEYPFKEYVWINPMPLTKSKEFSIAFNVRDIIDNKNVKYLRVTFWTYGNEHYKTLTSDLWIRNIKLSLSKAK